MCQADSPKVPGTHRAGRTQRAGSSAFRARAPLSRSRCLGRTAGPAGIPCASESVTSSALVAPRLLFLSGGRDCWPRGRSAGLFLSGRKNGESADRPPNAPNILGPLSRAALSSRPRAARCSSRRNEVRSRAARWSPRTLTFLVRGVSGKESARADLPLRTGYGAHQICRFATTRMVESVPGYSWLEGGACTSLPPRPRPPTAGPRSEPAGRASPSTFPSVAWMAEAGKTRLRPKPGGCEGRPARSPDPRRSAPRAALRSVAGTRPPAPGRRRPPSQALEEPPGPARQSPGTNSRCGTRPSRARRSAPRCPRPLR